MLMIKLNSIQYHPIERLRRKQIRDEANAIEKSTFRSCNGSIVWICASASPFCDLSSSHLQQKLNALQMNIVEQIDHLKVLKKLGTTISFRRPVDKKE